MTRTVNCLEEGGYVVRRPHDTDGRQVLVALTEKGRATLLADRARRDAWLAQRLRELTPDERDTPPPGRADPRTPRQLRLTSTLLSPTFRALHNRNYRLYAIGSLVSNTGTWMQRVAQDWLVLRLTDGSGTALGITTGLQFLPVLLLSPYAGADRRPLPQAAPAPAHPAHDGRRLAGCSACSPSPAGRGLAGLRDRLPLRHRLRVRRPGPPVVRLRDGRPRRPHQRGRPQLRHLQHRPASSARRWPA